MTQIRSYDRFVNRHLGNDSDDTRDMLHTIGVDSLDQLIDKTVPAAIRRDDDMRVPEAITEYDYLKHLKGIAAKNKVYTSYLGQGYYNTITPSVILRNVFENPAWYTQYTPYQAEIAQGRLEALLNFQTVVSDLTGLEIANASLLDEATAAAEAMSMFYGVKNKRAKKNPATRMLVDSNVWEQTREVLHTRAEPLDINVDVKPWQEFDFDESVFCLLLQYPNGKGSVEDYRELIARAKEHDIYVIVATDLLALTLLASPAELGADCAVGNTQRFGVPMGYGGPHAAFFATVEKYKRQIPGRIIGISEDRLNGRALRMALQTREQHIKRDRATSNICTAQALLAIMASFYAAYHGPKGLKAIAERIHGLAQLLEQDLQELGYANCNTHYFDTLCIECESTQAQEAVYVAALRYEVNVRKVEDSCNGIGISLDETTSLDDVRRLVNIFREAKGDKNTTLGDDDAYLRRADKLSPQLPAELVRTSEYLTHPTFNSYHSESKMMRYIKRLESMDLSLVHSMIPLGSCTMKLNAASELIPVSWPEFGQLHPFVPKEQAQGYAQIFEELSDWLCDVTGFTGCSFMPNSGAQGEYTGLLTIRAYHLANGDDHRNIALIPESAHGTNPASAVMAGMKVVVVKCDNHGNIDIDDLREKAEKHSDNLSSLMVTYPSTHGVFETAIRDICQIIHDNGGLVYMDGANMNAQVGLTSPGLIGADVCHLNLHKTFAIPHGGGGPGMGPICVNDKLKPFLPNHTLGETGGEQGIRAVASAPFSSASILLISYGYIKMLGKQGITDATRHAILTANYMKARLENDYTILYTGHEGYAAHEFIIDLRPFKTVASAEDIAKRLIDYGFHAPTLSFPVAGTIMIEPTESEDKAELDRFCDALLSIRKEIDAIASGDMDEKDNVLINAPHPLHEITANEWAHSYSREQAAYPIKYLYNFKFWPTVARVNNAYGDRNLICTCPPIESYAEA